MQENDHKSNENQEGRRQSGNIFGWKWSTIALLIILFFITIAVCRYLVIKPDRLIEPEKIQEF